jgi:putative FmdB family regulatory protein
MSATTRALLEEGDQRMPTYEYQCKTCGHHFERVQRFSDAPLTECPQCSGVVRRVIHPAGIVFKGSGWYVTDSRKGGGDTKSDAKGESKSEAKTESKEGATSTSSGESKPAEKATTD